jgi:hypothetical protein
MQSDDARTFQPAPSKGGFWSILFGVLIGGLLSAVFIPVMILASDATLTSFGVIFIAGISSLFCIVIHGYYKMAYVVSVNYLVLRWGFFKTVIPFTTIARIGKPNSTTFDGIRTGGVGIPDHLYGAFRLLIDGSYKPIKLVATKIANLVIIVTASGKYYGITPAKPDDFIAALKQKISTGSEKTFDNKQRLAQPESTTRKYQVLTTTLFIAAFIEAGINFAYMLVVFPRLPDIVPVHYDLGGIPNRFGSKDELVWSSLLPLGILIGLAVLLYAATRWKSQLQRSAYGVAIMLLPLAVGLVFLILNVVLISPLVP